MPKNLASKTWVGGIVNKTQGKNNFESVIHMIKNPRCQITTISYSSLVGFVFKCSLLKKEGETILPDEDVEFYGLNESKTAFDAPIDAIVIKLAILDRYQNKPLFPYQPASDLEKAIYKESDTVVDYKKEALVQSKIYQTTANKGEPICPALIDFSQISEKEAIQSFFNIMSDKCDDEEARNIITYLKNILIYSESSEYMYMDDVELGILSMESAVVYRNSREVISDTGFTGKKYTLCLESILTPVLRLYNETHLLHADFHFGNCLMKENEDGSYRVYMIDFGRMVDVDNLTQGHLELAHKYALSKFHRANLFRRKSEQQPTSADWVVSPEFLEKREHFEKDLCRNLLFLLMSLEYMSFSYNYEMEDKSNLFSLYYKKLDPETSLDRIAAALNDYYSTKGIYIQRFDDYNILQPGTNDYRTLRDIQGEDSVPVDPNASPPRIIEKRKTAVEIQEERRRRKRKPESGSTNFPPLRISNAESASLRSDDLGVLNEKTRNFDRLGFIDSDSDSKGFTTTETDYLPYSYPTVVESLREVKGGRKKTARQKKTDCKRNKSRRKRKSAI
jgi:hypothetical protein